MFGHKTLDLIRIQQKVWIYGSGFNDLDPKDWFLCTAFYASYG
jgi:hypothetical protein